MKSFILLMISILVTLLRFALFSRIWPITVLLIFDYFGILVVNAGSLFSCLYNYSFLCHPFVCLHPFPLFLVELLQFILHDIFQILCTFHMIFTASKAPLNWAVEFLFFIILFSYLSPFSFSHASPFPSLLSYLVYACKEYEWFYSSFPKFSHTLFCTQSKK